MYYGHICYAGFQVEDPIQQVFNGQKVEVWPRVAWKPKWICCLIALFFFLIFFLAPFCNKFNRFIVSYKVDVLSIDYKY